MSSQEHYFDLLPAYALGSLDEEEQLQVSEHLVVCAICQAELQAYDQIVEDMPLAMIEREPAPEVKNRVMAHARGGDLAQEGSSGGGWWFRLTKAMRTNAPAWGLVGLLLILGLGLSNIFL